MHRACMMLDCEVQKLRLKNNNITAGSLFDGNTNCVVMRGVVGILNVQGLYVAPIARLS